MQEMIMKRIMLLLSIIMLIASSSAQLEQHAGFPVQTGYGLRVPLVADDIDRDGKLEIIAAPENRMVKVFNNTGALKWENVNGISVYDYARVPVARDLTGDSKHEILSYGNPGYSDATFYVWDAHGIKLNEIWVGKSLLISSPAVTGDGMIITGAAPGSSFGTIINATGVYGFDSMGNKLWYLELGRSVNFFAPVALGDLDGDGMEEAIILTHDINSAYPTDGMVWAIKLNGTVLWSKELGGDARSAAVGDLNNDGSNEVVVVSSGGIYLLDRNGTELYKLTINSNNAPPAIGDLDGDGVNEVLIASNYDMKIYIISNGSLRDFSSTGRISGNLALGDLNNDGRLEIAAGDINGNMYIWDNTGNILEQRAVASEYFSSSAIADLERDGNKEIILGNYDGNIYVFTYRIYPPDTIPPVTWDDAEGNWRTSNVTVILTAEDNESGVAATYYTTDGSAPTIDSSQGSVINLTDGIYTIRYFSVDNAGNAEEIKTAANRVWIDTLQPMTTDDADNAWHNSSVTVNFNASDAGSGVLGTYYTTDGSMPANSSQNGTAVYISVEGIHTIRYFSMDNAGNAEPARTATVKIDMTPPLAVDDSDNTWHNADLNLNLNATDSLSGVAAINYTVDDTSERVSYDANAAVLFADEGIHRIEYYGVDGAGNRGLKKIASVNIDKSAPSTSDDVDGEWHNTSMTVRLSATDNLSGVNSTYFKIADTTTFIASILSSLSGMLGLQATQQGDNILISDEGVFNMTYYSKDNAGNTEMDKASGQVKIDKTLPVITVNAPENKTYLHSDKITLSFNARDALSGLKTTSSVIDGNRMVSDGQTLDMQELSAGAHEFYIAAEDNAGNLIGRKIQFSVATGSLGFINGTVTSNGMAVAGATVITKGGSTTTAADGTYSLIVQPGTYNVTVSKQPEYNNSTVAVTVDNTTIQDLVLIQKPTGTISGRVVDPLTS